ncbi:unnamed protein product [Bursaphelenchus xylophilus]|uniref:(pine wood nematode) hypothetical protein n=1 Tax=Bursaphelenchus xylophilus TaxID=6326 RepID=A0A1I7ST57_BURXY|nr:unnamed protein product [Bursaphelenchus xylophilus]CAG9108711.1 unnamed protein product [Bursaphelenchus xylophilus]
MKPWRIELPKIGGSTVRPIGVIDKELYVHYRNGNSIVIWSVNLFLPNSWKQRWVLKFEEIVYSYFTTSPQRCIYIFFTGCVDNKDELKIEVIKLEVNDTDYVRYKSSDGDEVMQLMETYDLHPETDRLCSGSNDLYIYDRGMIQGATPLLRISLNHNDKTFTGTRVTVPPEPGNAKFTLFGGFMDPDTRKLIKLSDSNEIHMFDNESGHWIQLHQDTSDSDINLNAIGSDYKGIGVTYNERHLRTAMVQSPISLITGFGHCIFLYKVNNKAFFFRLMLNQDAGTYTLKRVGRVDHLIIQSFNFCTEDAVITLGRPSYVIWLRSLTLKEIAYYKSQEICNNPQSDEPIRKRCKIQHNNPLF